MLKLAAITTALLITAGALAQSNLATTQKSDSAGSERATSGREYVDELIVTGERLDPVELDILQMDRMYGHKITAARQFIHGNYEEAFPTLLHLAKHGFVDAQARVGFIYLHGLGGQPKSNLKALGWLGVATSGDTRPQYRVYLNRLLAEVPEAQRALVTDTIEEYTGKYNHADKGISCFRGADLTAFTCRYEAEMQRKFDYMAMVCAAGGSDCPI